jgi:hypothetical protein
MDVIRIPHLHTQIYLAPTHTVTVGMCSVPREQITSKLLPLEARSPSVSYIALISTYIYIYMYIYSW